MKWTYHHFTPDPADSATLFMHHFSRLAAVLVLFVALTTAGCGGCDWFGEQPAPWKFSGERGDYEIIFPAEWIPEPTESLNEHAEVAASLDDRHYFLVIPQQLPSFPEPDVLDLKEEGMARLDEAVDDLVVERQGPVELDGVSGMTVFANGTVDGEPIRYITCYAIDGETGYQIIGFSKQDYAAELSEQMDTLLASWQFGSEHDNARPPGQDDDSSQPGPLEEADDEVEPVEDIEH